MTDDSTARAKTGHTAKPLFPIFGEMRIYTANTLAMQMRWGRPEGPSDNLRCMFVLCYNNLWRPIDPAGHVCPLISYPTRA